MSSLAMKKVRKCHVLSHVNKPRSISCWNQTIEKRLDSLYRNTGASKTLCLVRIQQCDHICLQCSCLTACTTTPEIHTHQASVSPCYSLCSPIDVFLCTIFGLSFKFLRVFWTERALLKGEMGRSLPVTQPAVVGCFSPPSLVLFIWPFM